MKRIIVTLAFAALTALAFVGCTVGASETPPENVGEAHEALLELGELCDIYADPWRCCSGICEKDANLPGWGRCSENKWMCGCGTEPPCP
jgi:hypothetical protein